MDTGRHIMVSEGVYNVRQKKCAEMVSGVQTIHVSGKSDGVQEAAQLLVVH